MVGVANGKFIGASTSDVFEHALEQASDWGKAVDFATFYFGAR